MTNIQHNVLIVVYNGEKFISDAISSFSKNNKNKIKIYISDNASTDNTSKIIKYLELTSNIEIKYFKQEDNIGEYKNRNFIIAKSKHESGIFHMLDADDYFLAGFFDEINSFIIENKLNPSSEKFIIATNVYKDDRGILSNHLENYKLKSYKNLFTLKLRNRRLGTRNTGISHALISENIIFKPELGPWADYLHTLQLWDKCENVYFINKYFPVYRLGSGVTSNLTEELDTTYTDIIGSKNIQLLSSYLSTLSEISSTFNNRLKVTHKIFLSKEKYKTLFQINLKLRYYLGFLIFKLLDLPSSIYFDGISIFILDLYEATKPFYKKISKFFA
jgi:glycosyltransferase involved in cell wall biosynthesis